MCNISVHCVCMQCDALASLSVVTQTVYTPFRLLCEQPVSVSLKHYLKHQFENLTNTIVTIVLMVWYICGFHDFLTLHCLICFWVVSLARSGFVGFVGGCYDQSLDFIGCIGLLGFHCFPNNRSIFSSAASLCMTAQYCSNGTVQMPAETTGCVIWPCAGLDICCLRLSSSCFG